MEEKLYIHSDTREFKKATLALGLGSFLVFSNMHMAQPLLPILAKEFHISPATSSLTVSLVTISLSIFLLLFGPISDAIGRKEVMALGLLASSFISIVIFFVGDFTVLLFLRTLQGVFLASLPAIAYAYIGEEFEGNSVGLVIGIYISGNSLGGMGGRIISGYIADVLSWKYSFLIIGFIGIISFTLFIYLLPKSKNFHPKKFSGKKAVKGVFYHWLNPALRHAYYIGAIIFFIFVGLFNYLGFYLHHNPYNLSTTFIGLLYLSYLAGTFSSTLSGKLENKLTASKRIAIGLFIMLIGIILMIFAPLLVILIGLTIVVFGFFFTHSAASSWVSKQAKHSKASASALYLFSYYLGGSIGSFVLGLIWEPFGWNGVIAIVAIILFLGFISNLQMKKYEEAN